MNNQRIINDMKSFRKIDASIFWEKMCKYESIHSDDNLLNVVCFFLSKTWWACFSNCWFFSFNFLWPGDTDGETSVLSSLFAFSFNLCLIMEWRSLIFRPWPRGVWVPGQCVSILLLLLVSDGWRIPPFLPSTGWIPPQLAVFLL